MSEPKRLHPIVIAINVSKKLKDFFFTIIALFFIGNKGDGGQLLLVGGSLLVVIYIFVSSFLSWLRYSYRLENGEIRIEYGVLVRKKRYIPFDRIQSIDISEGVLQRLFGMVKVQIETAGGNGVDEAEAVLSAISKEEAQSIQDYVAELKTPRLADTEEQEFLNTNSVIYKITTKHLLLLSLTSGGVGVVISAVAAFLSQIDELIPFERVFRGIETLAVGNVIIVAVLVFIGFFIAWILALIGTILKYANFTVIKTEHDLVISQGLLERRQITIPLNRIQAVRINENIIRQLLGFSTVLIESAGGSASNQEGSKVAVLPLIKNREIALTLQPLVPDYHIDIPFSPVPKRALSRYIFRSWLLVIPIVIIALIFLKVWGLLSLVILVAATFWAFLKFKDAGWNIEKEQLSLRYRAMVRTTILTKKNRIQSLEVKESYFQQKKELATIETFVKVGFGGAGGRVLDLGKKDVEQIFSWFSKIKRD